MAQFLLDVNRPLPARERISDAYEWISGRRVYHYPSRPTVHSTYYSSQKAGLYAEMHDSKVPRYKWKDVRHRTDCFEPNYCTSSDDSVCDHPDHSDYYGYSVDITELLSLSEVIRQPEVTEAMLKVSQRWVDQLYQLRQELLPDMGVFFAEANEISALYSIVQDFVRHVILVLRRLRDLRKNVRRLGKKRKLSPSAKAQYKAAVDELKRRTREYSSDLLGMRFGVMQPIRDLSEILASFYGYLDEFKMPRQTIHVREQVAFERVVARAVFDSGFLGCNGRLCKRIDTMDAVRETYEVDVVACTDQRPVLDGTKLEKLVALLLRQLEMVPTPDTIWELTPLSWLVDYFVNTSKFISKFTDYMGSMAGVTPIVYNSSISLKIRRVTTANGGCPRTGAEVGVFNTTTTEYYERLVGKRGVELMDRVPWLASRMTTGQEQNCVAFLIQSLL